MEKWRHLFVIYLNSVNRLKNKEEIFEIFKVIRENQDVLFGICLKTVHRPKNML